MLEGVRAILNRRTRSSGSGLFFVAPRVGPTGMAELALEGVSKIFGNHVAAVQDVNLTIRDQELVVLVGPSGSGKTTILRLIAGLEDLSNGVIRFDGRSVNQVSPRNRNIAMVFQHTALYPHLSVYNNIAFGLRMRRGGHSMGNWWCGATSALGIGSYVPAGDCCGSLFVLLGSWVSITCWTACHANSPVVSAKG